MYTSYPLWLASIVFGLIAADKLRADDVTVTTMVTGLQEPSGVAIRIGTDGTEYEIYVADAGVGRVVKIASGKPGVSEDAISGFAVEEESGKPFQSSGPRGLLFLERSRLVVAGGDSDRRAFVRLYAFSDEKVPLTAEQHEQHFAPPSGVVSFHTLARTRANDTVPDMLVLTALGNNGAAAIWKVPVRADTLDEPESLGPTNVSDESSAPAGIAVGKHGYIVVSESNSDEGPPASRLMFLNPVNGLPVMELPIELKDIVGLAYSPQTGNLYALNFDSDAGGGVYRIDEAGEPGKPATAAVKVADVPWPTALAFGPDGALYVTALGELDDADKNAGVLLKLTGEL